MPSLFLSARSLRKASKIKYSDMIYYDELPNNLKNASKLGIYGVHVGHGIYFAKYEEGITEFKEWKKRAPNETDKNAVYDEFKRKFNGTTYYPWAGPEDEDLPTTVYEDDLSYELANDTLSEEFLKMYLTTTESYGPNTTVPEKVRLFILDALTRKPYNYTYSRWRKGAKNLTKTTKSRTSRKRTNTTRSVRKKAISKVSKKKVVKPKANVTSASKEEIKVKKMRKPRNTATKPVKGSDLKRKASKKTPTKAKKSETSSEQTYPTTEQDATKALSSQKQKSRKTIRTSLKQRATKIQRKSIRAGKTSRSDEKNSLQDLEPIPKKVSKLPNLEQESIGTTQLDLEKTSIKKKSSGKQKTTRSSALTKKSTKVKRVTRNKVKETLSEPEQKSIKGKKTTRGSSDFEQTPTQNAKKK